MEEHGVWSPELGPYNRATTPGQGLMGRIGRRADTVRIVGRAGMTRGQGGRSGAAAPTNETHRGSLEMD